MARHSITRLPEVTRLPVSARIAGVGARCVIGLTGEVGGGKSTVRAWLVEQGAVALDADAVVHQVLAGDSGVIAAVRRRFGATMVGTAGVNRPALAAVVFADPVALADLEAILHPAVRAVMRAWLAGVQADVAVVEAVKVVEGGLASEMDQVWLVTCDRAVRAGRLGQRGWSAAEIARRLAAAPPPAPRLARADVVIDNSGSWPATVAQLTVAWARLSACGGRDARVL
jgi:dephospho-CoA kinase